MKLATQLVQAGVGWDYRTGAISMPIYQTATFRHPGLGQSTGFDYSRTGNPTRQVLEETICSLEGGRRGLAFASGMAAITALMFLFQPGDHILVSDDLYGGTYRLFTTLGSSYGLAFSFLDFTDMDGLSQSITPKTKAIFVETPTNPLMKIIDLKAVIALAKQSGLLAIVDNTFFTPYLQRPLEFGADLVVHSATKYIGGHNDVVAGLIASGSEELGEKLAFIQNAAGAVPGPQDCWLLLRGLKTLAARLEWAQDTALRLARFLQRHPAVKKVYYPGLPSHPGHELCKRQAGGFGAMLSFEVKSKQMVPQILARLKIISFAESLGGVESLITYPETQTHADIPLDVRRQLGINECLLRLSVGLEDPGDLEADLRQALEF
ncbi:MAG: PLP-dependent aspartate aminotransferase family protein [Bacillota bacterium]|nr:PLP-dependent aspartate aminotransferase family protein [Bacillota bacterium]